MKWIFRLDIKVIVIIFLVITASFSSCRIAREVPVERLKPVTVDRLMEAIDQHAFDYSHLTISRIQVQFANADTKTSFRVALKAVKDDRMVASVTKMNIPVGRAMLTPDTVIWVNYIDKIFFVANYDEVSEQIHFPVTFDGIQGIVSNQIFSVGEATKSNYLATVEGDRYLMQTRQDASHLQNRRIFRRNRSSQLFESEIAARDHFIEHKIYFNRRTLNPDQLILNDAVNGWSLDIKYLDFQTIDKKDFPGSIDVKMQTPDEIIGLKIKFNGISTDRIEGIGLTIPERYNRIRIK